MNILLVITKSEIGGAQVFVLNLARSLKDKGHNVEVVAGDGDYLFEELDKYGIKYYYFKSLKRDFSPVSSFVFIRKLCQLLNHNKYDILHLNSSNALIGAIAAKLIKNKPKVVFTFHGLSFLDDNFNTNTFIKKIIKFSFKFLLTFIDRYVYVSKLNYEVAKKESITQYGEVIYNGINDKEMTYYTKEEARDFLATFGIPVADGLLIGSIGRLAYQKNYEFLVTIFSRVKDCIPNAKLIIIGDGPDYNKLKNLVVNHKLEENIFFTGSLKDSYKYLKAFDIFTLPSRYEGLSISLIEALFADIPVLVSDVGGNPEIVDSSQLFKLDDPDHFVSKLISITENPQHFVQLNNNYKKYFLLEKMVEGYLNLYKKTSSER